MYFLHQPWGSNLPYCDRCVTNWITRTDPPRTQRQLLRHVTGHGPGWCVHCHACGRLTSRAETCPRCPCPDRHWLATRAAAHFGAALGRQLRHKTDLDRAWTLGHELCDAGFTPDTAADLTAQLDR